MLASALDDRDEALSSRSSGCGRRLAVTLNEMLDRIQASFERQRTFVDRASHELRTPLANLSMQLDLALRRERSGDELRAALMGAVDESRRLGRLASRRRRWCPRSSIRSACGRR